MIEATVEKIRQMCKNVSGKIDRGYFHWTAGRYEQLFDDYHISITGDGRVFVPSEDLTIRRNHTYQRNTGAVGIALCCAYGASPDKDGLPTGDFPPTARQIEVMARITGILAWGADLFITPNHFMTHAEAADLDGYGPATTCERWDLWKLRDFDGVVKNGGDVLRGKANWYRQNGL